MNAAKGPAPGLERLAERRTLVEGVDFQFEPGSTLLLLHLDVLELVVLVQELSDQNAEAD